jgi:hypothetical protein
MALLRSGLSASLSFLLSFSLMAAPVSGTSPADLGAVVFARDAHVGVVDLSVGTTIFVGDKLSASTKGSVQVRAGAARFLLQASSAATWASEEGHPSATLTAGTALFSTANSKAFSLHAGPAVFRPRDDQPTVGAVTLLNPKELVVRCSRGALTIAVEDDVRVIPEGSAYHIVLDPNASVPPNAIPTSPGPAPASWGQNEPIHPGKSKFIWYAIGFVALVTAFAISEASESDVRP